MHIKTQSRAIMATLAATLALTAVDMRPVAAATAAPQTAQATKIQASDATEFSSQRRHYNNRHSGYRGGNRAAAGAILGAFGAVAGIAVAESARRNYYRNDGYYDYGYSAPSYGYAQPYYAPYGGYGPRNEYFPN